MNDKELDQVVQQLAGDPQPTEADRQVAWRALQEAIDAEELPRRRASDLITRGSVSRHLPTARRRLSYPKLKISNLHPER